MRRFLWVLVLLLAAAASRATDMELRHGMVAAEHRLASEAGLRILRQGGNAVDAAVATALAVGVVNPTSCGIGGGHFAVLFDAASGRVHALDAREEAPAGASRDMYVRRGKVDRNLSRTGGLAVAVPGEVAGLFALLRRHGTMPFSAVAAPAIEYARDGFAIEAHLAESIAGNQERIRQWPALAARVLNADGSPPAVGDRLRQPRLAATLETIAREGPSGFYSGRVAAAIVESVRAAGGILDRDDLRRYRPRWRPPVQGHFRPYRVFGMPPPSSGGGVIVAVLNILRRDDLRALGRNTPTSLHLLAEAMQFAFADRAAHYGDTDHVEVPLARLTSPDLARRRRRQLSAATTFSPSFYGDLHTPDDGGTSHLSVVDRRGNAVALTTTINTSFGSLVVAEGTGIVLNNEMNDFSAQPGVPNVYGLLGAEANAIAPGKRPLSSMSPTIVTRNDEVALVAGASGGPFIISATLQVLLGTLVFDETPEEAVRSARIHHQWMPPRLFVEPGVGEAIRYTLRGLGHTITEVPAIASVQAVFRGPDGRLRGAADPRKGGAVAGW